MDEEQRDHADTNHPLHGEPRPKVTPFLVVGGFIVAFVLLMMLLIWVTGTKP